MKFSGCILGIVVVCTMLYAVDRHFSARHAIDSILSTLFVIRNTSIYLIEEDGLSVIEGLRPDGQGLRMSSIKKGLQDRINTMHPVRCISGESPGIVFTDTDGIVVLYDINSDHEHIIADNSYSCVGTDGVRHLYFHKLNENGDHEIFSYGLQENAMNRLYKVPAEPMDVKIFGSIVRAVCLSEGTMDVIEMEPNSKEWNVVGSIQLSRARVISQYDDELILVQQDESIYLWNIQGRELNNVGVSTEAMTSVLIDIGIPGQLPYLVYINPRGEIGSELRVFRFSDNQSYKIFSLEKKVLFMTALSEMPDRMSLP